eukprot:m.387588 g.387588  ORF g.387588 m.387588 type:complete len:738 (-) comp20066_c5_seq5:90-2303(-)
MFRDGSRHHPYQRGAGGAAAAGGVEGLLSPEGMRSRSNSGRSTASNGSASGVAQSTLTRMRSQFDQFVYSGSDGAGGASDGGEGGGVAAAAAAAASAAGHSPLSGRRQFASGKLSMLPGPDVAALQDRLRQTETELLVCKSTLTQKEDEVNSLRTTMDKEHIEHQQAQGAYMIELEQLQARVVDAERRGKFATQREKSCRAELDETRLDLDNSRAENSKRLRRLETEKQELQAELSAVRSSLQQVQQQSNGQGAARDTETRLLQTKLSAALAESAQYERRLTEATARVQDLSASEARAARLERSVQDLQRKLDAAQEDLKVQRASTVGNATAAEERRVRGLERENKQLREAVANRALLQQQLQDTREKLARAEARTSDLPRLELENAELKQRLASLGSLFSLPGMQGASADDIARALAQFQQTAAVAQNQVAELQTEVRVKGAAVEDLRAKLYTAEAKQRTLQEENSRAKEEAQRLQGRLLFASKERTGLKDILNSYDEDIKRGATTGFETQKQALIDHLEKTVGELQAANQQLEQRLQHVAVKNESSMDTGTDEEEYLDCDPKTTKILHMPDNPLTRALRKRSEELEHLRVERAALKVRVEQFEKTGTATGDVDPELIKNLEQLKSQLAASERRYERLKEVFGTSAQEFRETCYELFGFRIDVLGKTQYRLQSMFAEREEDTLVFQKSDQGVQLLQTDFSSSLQQTEPMGYLTRFKSIPAFLSGVTLDLFSKQTMM